MFDYVIEFIRSLYPDEQPVPLHAPRFLGKEKDLLGECIDSTFVSSIGKFVDLFEQKIAEFTGAKHAVALVNGTQALYVAIKLVGVEPDSEVITQSLTFVATANAISHTGAQPIFIDVDLNTMGMSPEALSGWLSENVIRKGQKSVNKNTGKVISACIPMHTLGFPCRITEISEICKENQIPLIEDAAESLGSFVGARHTGTFGEIGTLSFNGNKIITTGGGGMILTDNTDLALRAKHLTTTAKLFHPWEFIHDEIGYNFRMPNLNAALGVAQLEQLPTFLENKRELAKKYREFFEANGLDYIDERTQTTANFWLNALIFKNKTQRDSFLKISNERGVMTRAIWKPMHQLMLFEKGQTGNLSNTEDLYERVVKIPSSVSIK
jgi:perosamine synthetase